MKQFKPKAPTHSTKLTRARTKPKRYTPPFVAKKKKKMKERATAKSSVFDYRKVSSMPNVNTIDYSFVFDPEPNWPFPTIEDMGNKMEDVLLVDFEFSLPDEYWHSKGIGNYVLSVEYADGFEPAE